jgi:hypothetical protein
MPDGSISAAQDNQRYVSRIEPPVRSGPPKTMTAMFPDPAGAVYGTITVGALLAAESAQQETYLETVAAVVLALVLYVLAHSYSEFAGHRLREGEHLTLEGYRRSLVREAAALPGAAVPLLAVLIAWLVGASLSAAVNAAVWTSAGMVVLLELVAGVIAGETGRELAGQVGLGALLGLLVIVLKLLLH